MRRQYCHLFILFHHFYRSSSLSYYRYHWVYPFHPSFFWTSRYNDNCKILNTVVCGSSDDSQCSVFYVWSWFDLHFSEGKKGISMIFLNILIKIQGRITENLSLMQNVICALRIVNCHMTEPVIKEIMPSFRSFVFFETTDSADNLHAFLFISFPVICLN